MKRASAQRSLLSSSGLTGRPSTQTAESHSERRRLPGLRVRGDGNLSSGMTSAHLQLLPGGRPALGLTLALPILFVGAVAAVGAAGDGAEHAVMAGIMAGDTAGRGAFQAAFCRGGGCGGGEGRDGDEGEGFHDGGLREDVASLTASGARGS